MPRTPSSLVVAAFVLAGLPGRSSAQDAGAIDDLVAAAIQDATVAGQSLARGDRAGAVQGLDATIADAALAVAALGQADTKPALGKQWKAVSGGLSKFGKGLVTARKKMNDPLVSALAAVKTLEKSTTFAVSAQTALRRLPVKGAAIVEDNARSAGFHGPGATVEFTVRPGLDGAGAPCTDTPVVTIVDASGAGAVAPGYVALPPDRFGNPRFSVTMGAVGGAARVEVTACGVTRRSLLFNRGPSGTFPSSVTIDVARFDGAYAGTYTGHAHLADGSTVPVNGAVTMTVAGGTITVTSPGTGIGHVAAAGSTSFGGAGGTGGASYGFRGSFHSTVDGAASASGGWSASFAGGHASGSWSVAR